MARRTSRPSYGLRDTRHGLQQPAPGLFQAILDGLRDEPVNLILTIGRDQDPDQFGRQPENVHIERYIPRACSRTAIS